MANITELIKNIRNAIYGKDVRESIAGAIEQCYEDASKSGNANMEVTDARGNYNTLKKRLDNSDSVKADKTITNNLQNQINGLASGSPLVASSLSEMTDTSRVYVNTNDGHWYSYDGKEWIDGGVYQATEILINDENLIDIRNDINSYKNSIYLGNTLLINGTPQIKGIISDTTGIFRIDKTDANLIASEKYYFLPKNSYLNIITNGLKINLYFYDENLSFIESLYKNGDLSSANINLLNENYTFFRVGSWLENNTEELYNNLEISITNDYINSLQQKANIFSLKSINFNTSELTLEFSNGTYLNLGKKLLDLSNKSYLVDFVEDGSFIWYDYNLDIMTKNRNSDKSILIGAIWKVNNLYYVDLYCNHNKLKIDDMPQIYCNIFEEKTNFVFMGDSITEGVGCTRPYPNWIPQLTGVHYILNMGLGGYCITPKTDDYPSWETGIKSFYERLNEIPSGTLNLSLFGGVNDWITGRELGDISSNNTNTFYGALKAICEYIINKFPSIPFFVFTPIQTNFIDRPANIPNDNEYYGNTEGYNRKGLKLLDYVNAIKEVCELYSVPCCDLYNNSFYGSVKILGNNNGTSGIYGSDGLHLNDEGQKRLALKMSRFINNNY